jgi:hypothetical protein
MDLVEEVGEENVPFAFIARGTFLSGISFVGNLKSAEKHSKNAQERNRKLKFRRD